MDVVTGGVATVDVVRGGVATVGMVMEGVATVAGAVYVGDGMMGVSGCVVTAEILVGLEREVRI